VVPPAGGIAGKVRVTRQIRYLVAALRFRAGRMFRANSASSRTRELNGAGVQEGARERAGIGAPAAGPSNHGAGRARKAEPAAASSATAG
jgi:hypothetical protein